MVGHAIVVRPLRAVLSVTHPQWRVGAAVAIVVGLHVASTAVHAEIPGAAASATQRALANYVNDCAQKTIDCSTPTPTVTVTLVPTQTPTATVPATETPTAGATATATDVPCWLTDTDVGDPDNNFVVFDDDGNPVPCPTDQPSPTDEPTPDVQPSAVPTVDSVPPVRPAAPPAPVASQPVAVMDPADTYTPYPTYTPLATYTVAPSETNQVIAKIEPTIEPSATPTVPPTATATTTATLVPLGLAAPPPVHTALGATGRWSWSDFLKAAAIVIVVIVAGVWAFTRRKIAVWKPRSQKGATDASV